MKIPVVPDQIRVPAGEELLLIAHAKGFQIYVCRPGADGRLAWVLKAPEALLYDNGGNVVGRHFAGPTWQNSDGSEIAAKPAAKVDSPEASIPWLLLNVTGHTGNGILSRATTIQRLHTAGGLPPASACTAADLDKEFKSSYTADYYFYGRM